jgi:ubiquinone/menaquinone biosynthesis C-methylase UbiE
VLYQGKTVGTLRQAGLLCYHLAMLETICERLACPDCGAAVTPNDELVRSDWTNGTLFCTNCSSDFPVENKIVRLMPRELLDAQRSEIKARDDQVEAYDAMLGLNLFTLVELPITLNALAPDVRDVLLEAGCGTGRMTRSLAQRARTVIAIDFSYQSLMVNARKLKNAGCDNVVLVQADLCKLPFVDAMFDRVISCQVLEHVPTPEARDAAIKGLSRVAKPGATGVVSGYRFSRWTADKQGMHDGGIPYFRFTKSEFLDLLSKGFDVESITGALQYIHLARCRRNDSAQSCSQ